MKSGEFINILDSKLSDDIPKTMVFLSRLMNHSDLSILVDKVYRNIYLTKTRVETEKHIDVVPLLENILASEIRMELDKELERAQDNSKIIFERKGDVLTDMGDAYVGTVLVDLSFNLKDKSHLKLMCALYIRGGVITKLEIDSVNYASVREWKPLFFGAPVLYVCNDTEYDEYLESLKLNTEHLNMVYCESIIYDLVRYFSDVRMGGVGFSFKEEVEQNAFANFEMKKMLKEDNDVF